jgi:hypothetical protein
MHEKSKNAIDAATEKCKKYAQNSSNPGACNFSRISRTNSKLYVSEG